MLRPYFPPPGGVPREDLIRRLIFRGVKVEGPAIIKLMSTDMGVLVQPLTDPVPEEIVRSIARTFVLPVELLYVDHIDDEGDRKEF